MNVFVVYPGLQEILNMKIFQITVALWVCTSRIWSDISLAHVVAASGMRLAIKGSSWVLHSTEKNLAVNSVPA